MNDLHRENENFTSTDVNALPNRKSIENAHEIRFAHKVSHVIEELNICSIVALFHQIGVFQHLNASVSCVEECFEFEERERKS